MLANDHIGFQTLDAGLIARQQKNPLISQY